MGQVQIRSRILEIFPEECIEELYKICKNKRIVDNNTKVNAVIMCLNKYNIDFVELGPGTNRFAILIDGYVFKIALDKWGIQDNLNELTVAEELQPFVSKTYETNQLILVAEYVTVISKEEFAQNRAKMEEILSIISEGYLLGDVGIVQKNFCNWGYRDNGELVILDYAYIYRINGEEMLCSAIVDEKTGKRCGAMLQYDSNYHNMFCPKCRAKYTTIDIRRKITAEHEKHENEMAKQMAYAVTKPLTIFNDEQQTVDETQETLKEANDMSRKKLFNGFEDEIEAMEVDAFSEYDQEESILEALAVMNDDEDEENETDIVVFDEDTETEEDFISHIVDSISGEDVVESTETTVRTETEDGTHMVTTKEYETETHSVEVVQELMDTDGSIVFNESIKVSPTPERVEEIEKSEFILADENPIQEQLQLNFMEDSEEEHVEEDEDEITRLTAIHVSSGDDDFEVDEPEEVHEEIVEDEEVFMNSSLADAFRELGIESTPKTVEVTETERVIVESDEDDEDDEEGRAMLERIRKTVIHMDDNE